MILFSNKLLIQNIQLLLPAAVPKLPHPHKAPENTLRASCFFAV
jgi:hypothetical protein